MKTRYIDQEQVSRLADHPAIAEPSPLRTVRSKVANPFEDGASQTIRFGVAEPDGVPSGVLLAPAAWSDHSTRPFQKLRLGAMAKYSGLRVIEADFPGMGNLDLPLEDNELTPTQIAEAKEGRLTDLSDQYWRAMLQEGLLTAGECADLLPVALWGNSLSTLTVTELAASSPEDVKITDLYLSEVMGLQKIAVARLAGRMIFKGGKDLGSVYQARNTGLPDHTNAGFFGLAQQLWLQKKGHTYPVNALSGGKQQQVQMKLWREAV